MVLLGKADRSSAWRFARRQLPEAQCTMTVLPHDSMMSGRGQEVPTVKGDSRKGVDAAGNTNRRVVRPTGLEPVFPP